MLLSIGLVALAIIVSLAMVAAYYLNKLRQQKSLQAKTLEKIERTANEKYQKIRNDIVFIAKAYIADQVELPEASLRISRLLDIVIDERESREIYAPFDVVAHSISDIPTHKAWKDLDKKERKKYQTKMKALTKDYEIAAKNSAHKIVEQQISVH